MELFATPLKLVFGMHVREICDKQKRQILWAAAAVWGTGLHERDDKVQSIVAMDWIEFSRWHTNKSPRRNSRRRERRIRRDGVADQRLKALPMQIDID
jgi:hypothetical protein